MGILKEYDDFHEKMDWCLECHGLGFKRVSEPYRRYNNNKISILYKKFKCVKCDGSGKFVK